MNGVDPAYMTQADWKSVSQLLVPLWMILGSGLGLGFSMLLAQGMLPSLAASRDIQASTARRARPALYLAAVVFLAAGLFSVAVLISRLGTVSDIFYRGAI